MIKIKAELGEEEENNNKNQQPQNLYVEIVILAKL